MSGNYVRRVTATGLAVFEDGKAKFVLNIEPEDVSFVNGDYEISAGTDVVYCNPKEGYFGTNVWQTLHADRLGKVGQVTDVSDEGTITVSYPDGESVSFEAKSLRLASVAELSKQFQNCLRLLAMKRQAIKALAKRVTKKRKSSEVTKEKKKPAPAMDDDDVRDACWQADGSE